MWWLWTASDSRHSRADPLLRAFYWSIAAGLIRGLRLLPANEAESHSPPVVYQVFTIALVWVAAEWLRCYVASGFPWMPLGTTQSPIVVMCQVADIGGPWIVSYSADAGQTRLRRNHLARPKLARPLALPAAAAVTQSRSSPSPPTALAAAIDSTVARPLA